MSSTFFHTVTLPGVSIEQVRNTMRLHFASIRWFLNRATRIEIMAFLRFPSWNLPSFCSSVILFVRFPFLQISQDIACLSHHTACNIIQLPRKWYNFFSHTWPRSDINLIAENFLLFRCYSKLKERIQTFRKERFERNRETIARRIAKSLRYDIQFKIMCLHKVS